MDMNFVIFFTYKAFLHIRSLEKVQRDNITKASKSMSLLVRARDGMSIFRIWRKPGHVTYLTLT